MKQNIVKFGNIIEYKSELFLVIDIISDTKIIGVNLSKDSVVSNSSYFLKIGKEFFVDKRVKYNLILNLSYIKTISDNNVKIIDLVKEEKLDLIIRKIVKFYGDIYHNNILLNKNLKRYKSVSGKIIDTKELHNMLDASLDMWLTSGHFNDQFENELAEFLKVKYALTVNSGSSANLLAISALKSVLLGERRLTDGDEIITLAAGFPTTVAPIIQNNLIPVFIDVELGNYNAVLEQIEEAVTEKTKAIFLPHTLGNPFDLDSVHRLAEKYNLWLIEDNCDSLGAKYNGRLTGTVGDISTSSFYPAHHITTGEGGAVYTNNPVLYKILLSLRDWGRDCWCKPGVDNSCGKRFNWQLGNLPSGYDHKYIYSHLGYNLKMTDWQAAIGLSQLKKISIFTKKRNSNFNILYEGLKNLEDILILPESLEKGEPSWFGFLITLKDNIAFKRTDIIKYLEEHNIGTRLLFAGNILRQPVFTKYKIPIRIRNSDLMYSNNLNVDHYRLLPNTEVIMNNSFWIGLWPGLKRQDLNYMVRKIKEFVNLHGKF